MRRAERELEGWEWQPFDFWSDSQSDAVTRDNRRVLIERAAVPNRMIPTSTKP